MKLGLKLYPDSLHLIEKFSDIFDFFELLVPPDFDINLLKNISKPMTLHAAHSAFGFNMSDPDKIKLNKQVLEKALEAANLVNAKYIVVHPGWDIGPESENTMFDFLKDNYDTRFIFENGPIRADPKMNHYLFSTPEGMKRLLKKFNAQMLLDFGHSIVTANTFNKDPYQMIKDFEKLKPGAYHISGEEMDAKYDKHKNLFDVDNDYRFLKWIDKSKNITFETDANTVGDRASHLKNIEIVESIIDS